RRIARRALATLARARPPLPGAGHPAPDAVDRLPHRPGVDRVLEPPRPSPARPRALPPLASRVDRRAPPAVTGLPGRVVGPPAAPFVSSTATAGAYDVGIPVRLDTAFVRQALVAQVYTEPGEHAAVWRDGKDCGSLDLWEPAVDVASGRLRVT